MSITRMIARARMLVAVGVFAALALTAVAVAGHWPTKGGDAGHSGHQLVDPVGAPIALDYIADQANIRTSILTTSGDVDTQRMVYSTSDGFVHHRDLEDGLPLDSTRVIQPGVTFAPDANIFGSGSGEIAPVDASINDELGYTFQIFNEDAADTDPLGADIWLSIIRQSDGVLIAAERVPGTTNYTVNSTPVLFQQALWFIATPDAPPMAPPEPQPAPKLFKVNIGDPGGVGGNPTMGSVKTVNVASATATASPTAVYLRNGDGDPTPYVAVSTNSANSVRTFTASTPDPMAGPQSGDIGGPAQTVSVPVLSNGEMPQPGEDVETAPFLYVATTEEEPISEWPGGSQIHKLIQDDAGAIVPATGDQPNVSKVVLGNPAPMLAVSQLADLPDGGGHVVLTTSCDVYSFDVSDLNRAEPMLGSNAPDECPNTTSSDPATGFRHTTAVLSGGLGFVQRNNGEQIAFTVPQMEMLAADQFEKPESDATAAWGQPAISHRFVQFGDNKRVTVYRAETALPPGETGAGFSVNDVTIAEGNSGDRVATFTISRRGTVGGTVDVSTVDNTAKAGEDYTAVTEQTVTFTSTETSKTIDVPIKGDTNGEADETFFVRLSRPRGSGAHIVDGEGLGLIVNDDGSAAGIGITDITATEGTPATFNVTLSSPQDKAVTVNYVTADGTAKAGSDYTAISGKLVFNPGETSKPVAVAVLKDSRAESPERFDVKLSGATGSPIVDDTGTALISDVVRRKPRRFTANVRPLRDTAKPFRFVTTGRLTLPTGMSRAAGCKGRVQVQVKAGRKTISARRHTLRSTCRYRGRVTFKNAKRFDRSGRLKFSVRFLGNAELTRSKTVTRFVRTK